MPTQNPDASLLLTGDPGAHFEGRIGRTLADSMPHWKKLPGTAPGSPNVIVILLDDLSFSDFGCFGGEIDTPHINCWTRRRSRRACTR